MLVIVSAALTPLHPLQAHVNPTQEPSDSEGLIASVCKVYSRIASNMELSWATATGPFNISMSYLHRNFTSVEIFPRECHYFWNPLFCIAEAKSQEAKEKRMLLFSLST